MTQDRDQKFLEQELAALQVTANNFAIRFIPDSKVRGNYIVQAKANSDAILAEVRAGRITAKQGAAQAQEIRNAVMNAMRGQTSDLGLAIAKFLKQEGKSLHDLQEIYAQQTFKTTFSRLAPADQAAVWQTIVEKSGAPRKSATTVARVMGHAGRGLVALTACLAVYHVMQAEDKPRAAAREAVGLLGGMAGGAALGAAGGAFCGPAAIACVPIGIFVGGMLGAFGADAAFSALWK
jgi:hypothetical protein